MREVVRRKESRAESGERRGAPSQARERQCAGRPIHLQDGFCRAPGFARMRSKTFIHTFTTLTLKPGCIFPLETFRCFEPSTRSHVILVGCRLSQQHHHHPGRHVTQARPIRVLPRPEPGQSLPRQVELPGGGSSLFCAWRWKHVAWRCWQPFSHPLRTHLQW